MKTIINFYLAAKNLKIKKCLFIITLILFGKCNIGFGQDTVKFTTPGAHTWAAPNGVTTVNVLIWGAGGAGAGTTNHSQAGSGGGGGAFVSGTFTVTPGNSYNYYVGNGGTAVSGGNGNDGEYSWFISGPATGQVSSSGTALTRHSGSNFTTGSTWNGKPINLLFSGSGIVNIYDSLVTYGGSGPEFFAGGDRVWKGQTIIVNGANYTINTIISKDSLLVNTFPLNSPPPGAYPWSDSIRLNTVGYSVNLKTICLVNTPFGCSLRGPGITDTVQSVTDASNLTLNTTVGTTPPGYYYTYDGLLAGQRGAAAIGGGGGAVSSPAGLGGNTFYCSPIGVVGTNGGNGANSQDPLQGGGGGGGAGSNGSGGNAFTSGQSGGWQGGAGGAGLPGATGTPGLGGNGCNAAFGVTGGTAVIQNGCAGSPPGGGGSGGVDANDVGNTTVTGGAGANGQMWLSYIQTFTWTGNDNTTEWEDPGNWDLGGSYPGQHTGDLALITAPGTFGDNPHISAGDGTISVSSVVVSGSGNLTLDANSHLSVYGTGPSPTGAPLGIQTPSGGTIVANPTSTVEYSDNTASGTLSNPFCNCYAGNPQIIDTGFTYGNLLLSTGGNNTSGRKIVLGTLNIAGNLTLAMNMNLFDYHHDYPGNNPNYNINVGGNVVLGDQAQIINAATTPIVMNTNGKSITTNDDNGSTIGAVTINATHDTVTSANTKITTLVINPGKSIDVPTIGNNLYVNFLSNSGNIGGSGILWLTRGQPDPLLNFPGVGTNDATLSLVEQPNSQTGYCCGCYGYPMNQGITINKSTTVAILFIQDVSGGSYGGYMNIAACATLTVTADFINNGTISGPGALLLPCGTPTPGGDPSFADGSGKFDQGAGTTCVNAALVYSNRESMNCVATCDSYVWSGTTYTSSTVVANHFNVGGGCDSMAVLSLTINHSSTSNTTVSTCGSYVWNGTTYTASTTVTSHFTNSVGCDSAATLNLTITGPCGGGGVQLALTLFIQGYYQNFGSSTPMDNFGGGGCLFASGVSADPNEVDTVTISIEDPNTQSQVGASVQGILHTDGTVWQNGNNYVTLPGSVSGNNYYIAVSHRNAIQTWCGSTIGFTSNTSYNFSTDNNQSFGPNMILVDNIAGQDVYAFWNGDVYDSNNGIPYAQDGVIESGDYGLVETDYTTVLFGYYATDVTGDGVVESADYGLIETNYTIVIFQATPW